MTFTCAVFGRGCWSLLAWLPLLAGAAEPEATALAPVYVHGEGEFRQVHTWQATTASPLVPGASPLLALSQLPGVNFQSADGLGAYEWAVRLSARGFNQTQLGYTLDEIPLGDLYYSTLNGLYIGRALISENLARVRMAQGGGALEAAAGTNLGGSVQFYSQDPALVPGLRFAQTLGSAASQRSFVRLDSGPLANAGRWLLAAVEQRADLWKGSGHQSQEQLNFKYVQPAASGQLTAYFNYARRAEMDYQDLTKAWVAQLGHDWNNYWPNFPAALANASSSDGCCAAPVNGRQAVNDPLDAAYYWASGVREDYFAYVGWSGQTATDGEWRVNLYGHQYQGASTWVTPYKATPGPDGSPLSERVLSYDSGRWGGVAGWSQDWGAHRTSAGLWFEQVRATQTRLFFPVYRWGALWSPYEMPRHDTAFLTQWAYQFTTDTLQYHVQDVWQLNEQLSVQAGLKRPYSRTRGVPTIDQLGGDPLPAGELVSQAGWLPQIGLKWRIAPAAGAVARQELFFDAGRSLRNFQIGGYGLGLSPWAVRNQAAFDLARGQLRPETAWTYELGYRFAAETAGPWLKAYQGALSVYHVDFRDRLLNVAPGGSLIAATAGAAFLANVGGVTMNGIEASLTAHLGRNLAWSQSLAYQQARYAADYNDGNQRIAIAGKTVVDTPQWLYKSELTQQLGPYLWQLAADYLAKRYFTYTNDQSVPGRWLFNLAARADLGRLAGWGALALQLHVLNLTNQRYISSIGTSGFTASGDYQTLQVGAPRQVFVGVHLQL